MARTFVGERWLRVAALGIVALVIAAGCGGSTSTAAPSVGAPVVLPSVAAAPSVIATPTPSAVDVGAVFLKTMTDPKFSSTADIAGTMTVGPIDGTISGDAVFAAGDSSMDMTIDLDVLTQTTSQVQVDDQKWTKKDPGPWLEAPAPAADSKDTSIGKILQSLVKVTDLGVVTKNGASVHHLKFAGGDAVSGSMFGLDATTTKDAKFDLDFYADAAGVPAVMSFSGSWTQLSNGAEVPATMTMDITFSDVGTPQTVTPPTDVWVVYTSKLGYSMAHPADWEVTSAKNEDTYSIDGQGYVYVATQSYKGSTAKFVNDLKASYKKPFKGEPSSEKPTVLGGVPAVRLIYEFTNASGQDVTVADDALSRDGTGWEVYIATAGGQEDVQFFDTFVATFAFTE